MSATTATTTRPTGFAARIAFQAAVAAAAIFVEITLALIATAYAAIPKARSGMIGSRTLKPLPKISRRPTIPCIAPNNAPPMSKPMAVNTGASAEKILERAACIRGKISSITFDTIGAID